MCENFFTDMEKNFTDKTFYPLKIKLLANLYLK